MLTHVMICRKFNLMTFDNARVLTNVSVLRSSSTFWLLSWNRTKFVYFQLCGLAKQLDLTERQIERWWRLRRSQDKPSTLVKFCENTWKCTFYVCNFSFGLYILWDKEWLWDIDQNYVGYPHQVSFDYPIYIFMGLKLSMRCYGWSGPTVFLTII